MTDQDLSKTKTKSARTTKTSRRPAKGGVSLAASLPAGRGQAAARGSSPHGSINDLSINTIRTVSIDAVQNADSGHPGTPMALAPVVYTLWQNFLRFDPEDPIWPNRDRFDGGCRNMAVKVAATPPGLPLSATSLGHRPNMSKE